MLHVCIQLSSETNSIVTLFEIFINSLRDTYICVDNRERQDDREKPNQQQSLPTITETNTLKKISLQRKYFLTCSL